MAHRKWTNDMLDMANGWWGPVIAINIGIYGDEGCCGCTVHRRRAMTALFAVGGLLAAFIGLCMANAMVAVGGFMFFVAWGIMGVLIPNGCCGEYARDKSRGTLTCDDIRFYRWWFGNKLPCCDSQDAAAAPTAAPLLEPQMGVTMPTGKTFTPRALANIEKVKAFHDTYHGTINTTGEELDAFVASQYNPEFKATNVEGEVSGIDAIASNVKSARAKGWRFDDVVIFAATDSNVTYGYKFGEPSLYTGDLRIVAFVAFDADGRVLSSDYVKKV